MKSHALNAGPVLVPEPGMSVILMARNIAFSVKIKKDEKPPTITLLDGSVVTVRKSSTVSIVGVKPPHRWFTFYSEDGNPTHAVWSVGWNETESADHMRALLSKMRVKPAAMASGNIMAAAPAT